ncbi:hypothetical protein GCM10009133_17120 [Cocleimonas flava]|uniref:Uncharacterized protein n=1 Tax=Cocleimonas flava TaxID=634765 RepID=A0A4R1EZF7_9GAMM|nr:hypothetical protein [Cocleimonas flava]TCJ84638.1 hypothetical protein EV695_2597 [Cocleimonas flava]
MKKAESLYSDLIACISNISEESEALETYWNTLDEEKQNLFDSLTENISLEKIKLQTCKRNCTIYNNYDSLKEQFLQFNNDFSAFPGFSYSKVIFIIMISERIIENITEIQDEDIGISFQFAEVQLGFDSHAYASNLGDASKNLIWFNPVDETSLNELICFESDIECWYSILSSSCDIDFNTIQELLFCDESVLVAGSANKNVIELLKIHMASSGEQTVPVIDYLPTPSNSSIELYSPSLSYAQFEDVVGILGEYNNRKDVLTKYLSIFHIIENFMFKAPIVSLERTSTNTMFSIRDFKRLYKSVEINENKAIRDLFERSFLLPFDGNTFNKFAYDEWKAFIARNSSNVAEIEEFLEKLSLFKSYNSLTLLNISTFLSSVVYKVRCSIVHNKETEFHISSEKYPIGCKIILEDFLLKILEEMVFLLLSAENDLVWYKSNSITLWDESA